MQNGYSTKTRESASLSRRTFMSLAASSAALALPVTASAEGSSQLPASAPLQSLLDAHAEAKQIAVDLWDSVANIEEFAFAPSSVPVRVRYTWRLKSWINEETGERDRTPLYAYHDEEIEEVCRRSLDLRLMMLPESDIKGRQQAHEMCEQRIAALSAELGILQTAMDRLAEQCGLTAAEEAASAASDRRSELADIISYYVPATLREAALLAEWVSRVAFTDDCDLLFGVLANIARAGGIASGPPTKAQADRGVA